MNVAALQNAKAAWPILDQEQWYGLLSAAITKELVNAGFGQEFSEDEAANFLCAPTVVYPNTLSLCGSILDAVVQEITKHAKTVEDCASQIIPGIRFKFDCPAADMVVACLWAGASSTLAIVVSPERGEPYVVPVQVDDLHDVWDPGT